MTDRRALTMTEREAVIDILHRYRRGEAGFAEDAASAIFDLFKPIARERQPLLIEDEQSTNGEKNDN